MFKNDYNYKKEYSDCVGCVLMASSFGGSREGAGLKNWILKAHG